jgi:erythronate-4-phosphate dehydrogenase
MKIVVDDKIPYIRETICRLADEVVFLRGADITAVDVRDADVLVVRTRTRCNRQLLEGSTVQLVVTATIGFDHLDT